MVGRTICTMTDAGIQPQRTNRRGDATRENMLEAALKALATGDPGAVSANRIAKQIGATWGAVKYQFGDADGLWAAVLHRTAEHRADVFAPTDAAAPLRQRVAAHHRHSLRRPDGHRLAGDREPARRVAARPRRARTPLPAHGRRTPVVGAGLARHLPECLRRPEHRSRTSARVATFIPGAMRGIASERQLGSYYDLDLARQGLTNAIVAYLELSTSSGSGG